jgi:hypothetical protein
MPAKNKIVSQIVEDLVSFGMDTEYVTRFGFITIFIIGNQPAF